MDDYDLIDCPYCGTWQHKMSALLGVLGIRYHFRCRACGADWSSVEED